MKSLVSVPLLALLLFIFWGCEKEPVNLMSDYGESVEFRSRGNGQNGDCFNFKADVIDAGLDYFEITGDYDIPYSEGWGAPPFDLILGEISGKMASIVTNIIPNPQHPDRGATHYRLMHFFVTNDGESYFYTSDKAVCAPVQGTANPCHVNDQMTIIGGGGYFEGVTGKIGTHGEILITGVNEYGVPVGKLNLRLHGRVCVP